MKTLILFLSGCLCGKVTLLIATVEIKRISHQRIDFSLRYQMINELVSGMMLVLFNNRWAIQSAHFYFAWVLFIWLDLLSLMDILKMYYSNRIFFALGIPLCVTSLWIINVSLIMRLWAMLEVWILFRILIFLFNRFKQADGMGEGDVALFIMLAFMFGRIYIYLIILLSAFLGICSFKKGYFPFVPFIFVSSIAIFYLLVPLF